MALGYILTPCQIYNKDRNHGLAPLRQQPLKKQDEKQKILRFEDLIGHSKIALYCLKIV